MDIDIRSADADMIGTLVFLEYFSAVLHRVMGVSCALCPDCIGNLYLPLTGVVLGPDCIVILCYV